MRTGTHPHSFIIGQMSKPQEIRGIRNHTVWSILVRWLVSKMHSVCFPKWNKQQLMYAAARLFSQTHFPLHVPYASFPKTIQQLLEWQSSNLQQQFRGGQTDGPVTGRVGGDGIQTQRRREGGMIARGRGKKKERVAFRLGVGSDGEAAVHIEMKLCKKVWGCLH